MTPDVTVVMPAWQVEPRWLAAAVASALAESGCALEVVVVDDGNAEPLAETLTAGPADPRLRVVRVEHGGAAAARNVGMANARGRLIRFVDADDALVRGSTARLLALVAGRDDVIAYGATVVCDEELRPLRTIESRLEGDVVEACLLGEFDVRHVSMLFPRRVVEQAGEWRGGFHVSEDWDFVLRTLEHARVRRDPLPATLYRRHDRSLTGLASVAAGEEGRRRVVEGYFERHPELRGSPLARRALAATHLASAAGYAATGDRGRALDRLARGARLAPLRAGALAARLVVRSVRPRLARRLGRP